MASNSELACVYAALVLHDDGVPITDEKISTLVNAAGVTIEPYWPSLFAKLLQKVNIDDLIGSIGSAPAAGGGGGAAAGSGGGGDAGGEGKKEEEKKEESEEEEEGDMDFDLFD